MAAQLRDGSWVRAGIPGQADAYAYVRGGLVVEIETKSAAGRLEAAQRAWRDFCRDWGVTYLVLRAGRNEAPGATVARWLEELGRVAP